MASRLTVLYYDGSKWVELKNRETNAGFDSENATTPSNKPYFYSGGSPVLAMELEDLQGAPLQIKLTLNNRQNKPRGTFTEPNNSYTFGEDPLVNPQVPQFHGLLAEFTRLMVFEADTYMTLFVGRVLKREETYDLARGSTLTLTCRDALHELTKNSPFQYAQGQQILTFRTTTTYEESGGSNIALGDLETRNHYHIIKKLIEQTSFANSTGNIEIGFTDTDKIESWTTAPRIRNWAEDSVRVDSQNGFFLNKVRSKNTLTEIQDQASAEVWALGANKMGFTFHLDATRVDPRLRASGATLLPQQDFTYARRGYKSTSNTTTQALAVKYAVNSIDETVTLTTTDKTRNMLQDGYEFEAHGNPFMSHLILTYPHTKELNRDKPGGNNPKGADRIVPKFANYFDWNDTGANADRIQAQTPSPRYWDASETHAVINGYTWDMYDVLGIDPESDEEVEETLAFTLLYVQPYDSNDNELEDFSINYADGDISQDWPSSAVSSGFLNPVAAGTYKGRTFHQVSSLHTKIGPMGHDIGAGTQDDSAASIQQVFTSVNDWPFLNYGTKTWIGNVQIQGKDEEGNHYIIISHPQEDVLRTLTAGDVLYERSHYYEMDHSGDGTSNPRGAKIKFVSYPAADKGWKQTLKVNSPKAPYQELRNRIENQFLKANNKVTKRVRSGTFRIKDYPHITRKGTAGLLSSGSALYPSESFGSGTTPAYYGMKRGCAVQRTSGHADKYVGYIGTVNATNVVASLWKEDTLANASPVVGSWAPGDTYSISVPLRAGDSIRVENLLLGIAGNFLIESIYYSWANGQVYSEIETIGMNDLVVFKSRSSIDLDNDEMISELVDPITIEKTALASGAYSAKGVLWWHDNEHEETPSEVSNPLKKDYNTFSWSGGSIIIHSGRKKTYIFKAGDTDEALVRAGLTTFNDSTDPGAPSPANTCMGPNTQYILYLDRKGTTDAYGRYSLNIDVVDHSDFGYSKADSYIELAYMHIGTLEDAGSKTIGKPGTSFYSRTIEFPKGIPNIQFLYVFDNTWGLSSNIMNPGFSFNKNSMTSALLKPGARPWASNISIRAHTNENYNQIMWDNGSANGASTLTYGDATSISIAAGAKTTGLDDNRTYYMYIDTGASTTPQFTESHATATGDAQLLLALIVVGDDTNQTAPTILPFNSKVPTLNAVAIAANAIIADHIQAGTINTTKLNIGTGTNQIAGLTSAGSLNLSHIGSGNMDNIGDGSTYGKLRITNMSSGNLDFESSGIANKTMDNIGEGSTYGRIKGRDLTDGDIDFNNSNYLNKSLNYIDETSTRKHVSANQRDGGGRGYAGLNTNNRVSQNIVAAATSHGENVTAYFYGGTSDSPSNLLLINAAGFASYAGVTGAYPSFTLPTYATFQVLTSNGQAQFGSNTVIADSTGLKVYSAATSGTLRTWLKSNSGIGVTSGYGGGIHFQNLSAGASGTYYSTITTGSGTNSTYGHSSNNTGFQLASTYEDIIINSAQDVYLRPKTGGTYEKEGYVKVGDRPIVFMDQDAASPSNSLHLSTMDFVGFWKKAGAISYSTVYRLPWRTSSSSPTDGQVLAIDGSAKEMDGTVLYGTVGVPSNPYVFDLKWADAGSVSSPLRLDNGTYEYPTYSFSARTQDGMYSSGTNGLGFSYGGSTYIRFNSSIVYNYKQQYIGDAPDITSGGNYLKIVSGVVKELTSTERAKMDIQSIAVDTSKLYDLEPKSFRYRAQQVNEDGSSVINEDGSKIYTDVPAEGVDSPLQFGMIAEEVYAHIPELVSLNATNQPIGLDYPLLSVLLLEELKKLKARIDVLEGN